MLLYSESNFFSNTTMLVILVLIRFADTSPVRSKAIPRVQMAMQYSVCRRKLLCGLESRTKRVADLFLKQSLFESELINVAGAGQTDSLHGWADRPS